MAALLCAAAGVSAQTDFGQRDAAGRAAYSGPPDAAPRTAAVSAAEVARALASNTAMSSRNAAKVDANEAARRLRQTQLEREQGAEPLPRERTLEVGGVSDRYRLRQEKLRQRVEQAQRRLNETRRLRR